MKRKFLLLQMQSSSELRLINEFNRLQQELDSRNGYFYEKEYNLLLGKFGFLPSDKQRPLSTFSGGQLTKLGFIRLLLSKPDILLLDEPAAGMNPQETHELMKMIAFIRKEFDVTILLIEHDMKLVMGICEKILVLDYGRVIASGKPEDIRSNPQVIKAYLGGDVKID